MKTSQCLYKLKLLEMGQVAVYGILRDIDYLNL